ncbi:chemotaxis protein CheX [Dactylosporangium sp. McL0621]|uniref:chemotaxis protein CheX n=1 Tax=Dactylosporangium sp. McL0621 TaxID=3415678 RepID=UPI003CEB130F
MRSELDDGVVGADALQGIVWQVWTAYPGGTPPAGPPPADACAGPFDVTAGVSIAGAWNGHVLLRCRADGAAAIAAAMLEMPAGSVRPEDVVDAAGELMNIIAGNVKSLLPQPSVVALPQVVLGEADVVCPGSTASCELRTAFEQWPVHLSVLEVPASRAG